MKPANKLLTLAMLGACTIAANPANAALLIGTVTAQDGQPVAGAMVTLWNTAKNAKETVYTNEQGQYSLTTGFTGKVVLRTRMSSYKDQNNALDLAADTDLQTDVTLQPLTAPEGISDQLTASAHAAALPFYDTDTKDVFIRECTYCHQQGNSLTRRPRDKQAWSDTDWRMEGYGAYITYGEHARIVDTQLKGFTGKPVVARQDNPYNPELSIAKVYEWHAGNGLSFIHDAIVGFDEKLYGFDEGKDMIYIQDRKTGKLEEYEVPADPDVGVGGDFNGVQLPLGIFTGKVGLHSAAQIPDGRMFMTASLDSSIMSFDPKTKEFKTYQIPRGFLWRNGIYPHTIRADKDGNVWFTTAYSSEVYKLNTTTGEFTRVKLPSQGFATWMSDTFMGVVLKIAGLFPGKNYHLGLSHHKWLNFGDSAFTLAYGIDIDPVTGNVWYSKVLGNRIGMVNKDTLEVTEYDTPYKGPRRLRFGPDGILWIPSFDEGYLMRFDPKTEKFESTKLPLLASDEYEVPYALNVHPKSGDVWIASNNSDRVLRYIPKDKRFIPYPMPQQVIWFRDLEFSEDGNVCMSNSNLPAYAHEDKVPAFFCIEPEPNGAYGHR
ncbi:Streptogramin lyase [Pseudomonas pohangensis]|uniref:Streptogramin lyase n=1 Tax=Pseudomonas pohangensis TaxID=364197 RepID=A0A1H2EMU5_9PSED|nr:carboxypeptidase regulatory-like domain-containing protein [Pseudomonas pohangensis]SDT96421.1 Streptogramin lyase [Pseudomonas pohangensis]